jgi:hypothetical protein
VGALSSAIKMGMILNVANTQRDCDLKDHKDVALRAILDERIQYRVPDEINQDCGIKSSCEGNIV